VRVQPSGRDPVLQRFRIGHWTAPFGMTYAPVCPGRRPTGLTGIKAAGAR
jgi:hypothetical protein